MRDSILYTTLFEQIMAKIATICSPKCPTRRILKMKKHGWKVKYSYETIHITNKPYDGLCVLCQDTIVGDHSTFECKCAHICMCCLRTHYAALPRCTICKREVDYEKLKNDIRIYVAIQFDKEEEEVHDDLLGRPGTVFLSLHDMVIQLIQEPEPVD